MTSSIKKAFLIYILFLFTTFSGSPIQATESSPSESDLAFQQAKERIELKQSTVEKTVEEKIQERALAIQSDSLEKEQKATEAPLGIIPALIEIPAIDERAEIIPVGQTADGNMEAPEDIHTIGWYEFGKRPGSNGNAVVAGHVDGLTGPGTFYNLKKLEPGDQIHLTGSKNEELTFVVIEKQAYAPEEAPLHEIFGNSSTPQLNLITCTGTFNTAIGHYEERLVVYTELMES